MLQGREAGGVGGGAGQAGPNQVTVNARREVTRERTSHQGAAWKKTEKEEEIRVRGWAIYFFPPSLISLKRCRMVAFSARNAFLEL